MPTTVPDQNNAVWTLDGVTKRCRKSLNVDPFNLHVGRRQTRAVVGSDRSGTSAVLRIAAAQPLSGGTALPSAGFRLVALVVMLWAFLLAWLSSRTAGRGNP